MTDRRADVCPHARINFCPLYTAAHFAGLPTCIEDLAQPCRAAGKPRIYRALVAELRQHDPEMVVECALAELAREVSAQRDRNMRFAGARH